jgi:hypothetical protein
MTTTQVSTRSREDYSIQTTLAVCSRCTKDGFPAEQQKFLTCGNYLVCTRDGARVPVPGRYPLPSQVGSIFRNLLERHGFEMQRFEPNMAGNLLDENNQLSRLVLVHRQRADLRLTLEWFELWSTDQAAKKLERLPTYATSSSQHGCSTPLLEAVFDDMTDQRKDRLIWRTGSHASRGSSARFRQNYEPEAVDGIPVGRWLVLAAEMLWDPSQKDDAAD